jgi:exonuclease VII large subunit
MPLNTESRKAKIKKFITFLKENKDDIAVQELDEILEVITEEHKNFVYKSDLKELIIEMREGFKTMDKRFEAMDKRFQDLIHYMDKRFEEQIHYIDKRLEEQKEFSEKRFQAIDKRFEELLHYMDKRFEAVDKRFEELIHNIDKRLEEQKEFSEKRFQAIDKRFEEINNNIKFFQWFLSIFISVLFGITSLFFYYNQAQNEKFYNQIISSLNNLNIQNNKNNR